jgi:hypothetical protein
MAIVFLFFSQFGGSVNVGVGSQMLSGLLLRNF